MDALYQCKVPGGKHGVDPQSRDSIGKKSVYYAEIIQDIIPDIVDYRNSQTQDQSN